MLLQVLPHCLQITACTSRVCWTKAPMSLQILPHCLQYSMCVSHQCSSLRSSLSKSRPHSEQVTTCRSHQWLSRPSSVAKSCPHTVHLNWGETSAMVTHLVERSLNWTWNCAEITCAVANLPLAPRAFTVSPMPGRSAASTATFAAVALTEAPPPARAALAFAGALPLAVAFSAAAGAPPFKPSARLLRSSKDTQVPSSSQPL
mmetsp:Transcript_41791/g.116539  ORF Transcript_41791/g.116539 Transcript_41791/m.116539 type:complete len:203 (-) Transcript_41791:192-800(-)